MKAPLLPSEPERLEALRRYTSIGIPADKCALMFDAFSQADGSISRRYGGTGLGLTISSKLVHLMRGRIWIESLPGQGSTFYFTVKAALEGTDEGDMTTSAEVFTTLEAEVGRLTQELARSYEAMQCASSTLSC